MNIAYPCVSATLARGESDKLPGGLMYILRRKAIEYDSADPVRRASSAIAAFDEPMKANVKRTGKEGPSRRCRHWGGRRFHFSPRVKATRERATR